MDLIKQSIEQTKINTRRYARTQRKWIKKRFASAENTNNTNDDPFNYALFRVDSSNVDEFYNNSMKQAISIVKSKVFFCNFFFNF